MILVKVRSLPQSGGPERGFTWVGSSFTLKHYKRIFKTLIMIVVNVRSLPQSGGPER
jgi:hypothetical protein